MNSKQPSGSILADFGTFSLIVSSWTRHFFFTLYHIVRGTSLEGVGEFNPGQYGAGSASVDLFVGTRLLVWAVVHAGLALVAWEVWEDHGRPEGRWASMAGWSTRPRRPPGRDDP